jgi:DNA-directed RNA polymerase subunit RPC12/RpoP
MKYDYTCEDCSHEFDYDDGLNTLGNDQWIECPNCKTFIDD